MQVLLWRTSFNMRAYMLSPLTRSVFLKRTLIRGVHFDLGWEESPCGRCFLWPTAHVMMSHHGSCSLGGGVPSNRIRSVSLQEVSQTTVPLAKLSLTDRHVQREDIIHYTRRSFLRGKFMQPSLREQTSFTSGTRKGGKGVCSRRLVRDTLCFVTCKNRSRRCHR